MAKPRKTTGRGPTAKWSPAETAFILTYSDRCIQEGKDYKKAVVDATSQFCNRDLSWNSIYCKLRNILKSCGREVDIKAITEFTRKGVRWLNLRALSPATIHEMQQQFQRWNLGNLAFDEESESSPVQDDSNGASTSKSTKRKATTQGDDRPGQDRLEVTVSDSGTTVDDSLGDSDFNDIPAQRSRKKQKMNSSAPESSQRQRNAPATLSTTNTFDDSFANSLSAGSTSARIPPVVDRKRKANSETISGSAAMPPSKRQANGKLSTVSDSEEQTSTTHLQGPTASSSHIRSHAAIPVPVQHASSSGGASHVPRNTSHQSMATSDKSQASTPMLDRKFAENFKDVVSLVGLLIKDRALSTHGITKDMKDLMESIMRDVDRHPGKLLDRLATDLHSALRGREHFGKIIRDLIGQIDPRDSSPHPRKPDQYLVENTWSDMYTCIRNAFGFVFDKSLPEGVDVGFLTACIYREITNNDHPELDIPSIIEELSPRTKNVHIARALFAAMVMRLFSGPEPLCESVHNSKDLKVFDAILSGSGPEQVQHLEKMGLKFIFDDEEFQAGLVKHRATKYLEEMKNILHMIWPEAEGFKASSHNWTNPAVKLKQALLLSPKDYRIHFCTPGMTYNPMWMQAEDGEAFKIDDHKAAGKKVVLCVFPALVEQEPAPFTAETRVPDLLAGNKKFFPTFQERINLNPKSVRARAIVLVE